MAAMEGKGTELALHMRHVTLDLKDNHLKLSVHVKLLICVHSSIANPGHSELHEL